VVCAVPPLPPKSSSSAFGSGVALWLSPNNGYDWVLVNGSLKIASTPQMLGLGPASGPVRGHTVVSINGVSPFDSVLNLPFCRFGALEVPAAWDAATSAVSCLSPAKMKVGAYNVSVVLRQAQGKFSQVIASSVGQFTVVEDETVTAVFPKQAASTGGNVITISGSGFSTTSPYVMVRFSVPNDDGASATTDILVTGVVSSRYAGTLTHCVW
jgi:hypothetical protein